MFQLSPENAIRYLAGRGELTGGEVTSVQPLAWGVSNLVLRVDRASAPSLVIKQSQPQLRTAIEWFSRCERIYREADALRVLSRQLPDGVIPGVIFEDRENYILGLEAIRPDHIVWKEQLLKGEIDPAVAQQLGRFLARIHGTTAGGRDQLPDAEDWSIFDELRIDPFYRWIARVHPALQPPVDALLEEMAAHRVCLVHADFSPKNVLIHPDGVSLVDFETAHVGDPAFDLGFFLSHLLLKELLWREKEVPWWEMIEAFVSTYRAILNESLERSLPEAGSLTWPELSRRAVRHLAACLLARVDGKSPVDYLVQENDRNFVRAVGCDWLRFPPVALEQAFSDYRERQHRVSE